VRVYRGTELEADRLARLLTQEGLPPAVERYGPAAAYVLVKSHRPDLDQIARSAGRSIRRVFSLEELQATAQA
jgi:hypothetical protein